MNEQEKATDVGFSWGELFKLQADLHTSARLSTSFTVEAIEDVGQYKLLCVVTAIQGRDNNLPGNGGGTSFTVEYHDVSSLPGRVEEALCVMHELLEQGEDIPF